jgi:glycosyltransferase involved in cell wall biosynthesis
MDKQRVSIAMCTYNGTRYIQEQLDSIAAQTRLPDELVVCDKTPKG